MESRAPSLQLCAAGLDAGKGCLAVGCWLRESGLLTCGPSLLLLLLSPELLELHSVGYAASTTDSGATPGCPSSKQQAALGQVMTQQRVVLAAYLAPASLGKLLLAQSSCLAHCCCGRAVLSCFREQWVCTRPQGVVLASRHGLEVHPSLNDTLQLLWQL